MNNLVGRNVRKHGGVCSADPAPPAMLRDTTISPITLCFSDPDLEAVRLLSQGLGVDFIHELNKQKMTESACAEKLFSTFRS